MKTLENTEWPMHDG